MTTDGRPRRVERVATPTRQRAAQCRGAGRGDPSRSADRVWRSASGPTVAQQLQDLTLYVLDTVEAPTDAPKTSTEAVQAVALPLQGLPHHREFAAVCALGLGDVAEQLIDVVDVVSQLSHHAGTLGVGHGGQPTGLRDGRRRSGP